MGLKIIVVDLKGYVTFIQHLHLGMDVIKQEILPLVSPMENGVLFLMTTIAGCQTRLRGSLKLRWKKNVTSFIAVSNTR